MPKVQVTLEFDSLDETREFFSSTPDTSDIGPQRAAPKSPAAVSAEVAQAETQVAETGIADKEFTDQDCRQAVLDYSNALGAEAMKEQARAFGVKSTKELKPEQYAAFIKHMEVPKS